jgi:uncharacterized membrane protein YhaH (DUF805 family)
MDLMLQPLRKYAEFTGRARRSEFWLFWLFTIVASGIAGVLDAMLFGGNEFQPLQALVGLGLLIPSLAVSFRRLHDTDKTAWWLLLWLLPILGWIALLVFYLTPGAPGPNKYGPDPKETAGDIAATFG